MPDYNVSGLGFDKTAYIDGYNGPYGQSKPDNNNLFDFTNSVNYGRNTISNLNFYNKEELGQPIDPNNPPALNYEVKYLPEENANKNNLNTMALMGASFEDTGHVNESSASLDKLMEKLGKQAPHINIARDKDGSVSLEDLNKLATAAYGENAGYDAYDLNKDGRLDIAENSIPMLIADMLDNQDPNNPNLDDDNIDGKFTRDGYNNSTFMLAKNNIDNNRSLAQQIYDRFNLGEAMNRFLGRSSTTEPQNNQNNQNITVPQPNKETNASDATRVNIPNPKQPAVIPAPQGTTEPKPPSELKKPTTPVEQPKTVPTQETKTAPVNQKSNIESKVEGDYIDFTLKKGQGIGDLIKANRKVFEDKYGTKDGKSNLWGDGGLVDQFAKANNFKGWQDPELAKLQADQGYSFVI